MFEAFRKMWAAPMAEPAGWRCPSCLVRVKPSDLEWRCPKDCSLQRPPAKFLNGPKAIIEEVEQSCHCYVPECSIVHTQPYPTDCDRPFGHYLNWTDEEVHHVVAASLEGNGHSLAALRAALLLGEDIVDRSGQRLEPLDVPSRQALHDRQVVRVAGTVAISPGSIGVRRRPGRRLLYVHHLGSIQAQRKTDTVPIDSCRRQSMTIGLRVAAANSLALAVTTDGATAERDAIAGASKKLRETLDKAGWPHPRPSLLIVLTDEERLSSLLGEDILPGLRETRPEQRASILESYVLDGLRLREPLRPLLDAPWQRCAVGTIRMPLSGLEALAGFAAWFDMIGPRR
jgi:hypothetical protein